MVSKSRDGMRHGCPGLKASAGSEIRGGEVSLWLYELMREELGSHFFYGGGGECGENGFVFGKARACLRSLQQ